MCDVTAGGARGSALIREVRNPLRRPNLLLTAFSTHRITSYCHYMALTKIPHKHIAQWDLGHCSRHSSFGPSVIKMYSINQVLFYSHLIIISMLFINMYMVKYKMIIVTFFYCFYFSSFLFFINLFYYYFINFIIIIFILLFFYLNSPFFH